MNEPAFLPADGWWALYRAPEPGLYLAPVPVLGWVIEREPVLRYRGVDSRHVENGSRFCDEDTSFSHFIYDPSATLSLNVGYKLKRKLFWLVGLATFWGTLVTLSAAKLFIDWRDTSVVNWLGVGTLLITAIIGGWVIDSFINEALA